MRGGIQIVMAVQSPFGIRQLVDAGYGKSHEIGDEQGLLYCFGHASARAVQREQRGEDAEHADVRLQTRLQQRKKYFQLVIKGMNTVFCSTHKTVHALSHVFCTNCYTLTP